MIALACDHGGFKLKEEMKAHLESRGVRAACCSDHFSAKYTRLHNDANILCLGGRVVGPGLACELVDTFLDTAFEGGRHQHRIDLITQIETEQIEGGHSK